MHYIHYPSGGFGHFMLQMSSICFDDVFCPQEQTTFSKTGNSHSYPLHYKTWLHSNPFSVIKYYDFQDKKSICLIDSGINDDKDRGVENTIRMCIDEKAKSIISQTCREKAEALILNESGEIYQQREKFSLFYHHMDQNSNFYLNNFQPVENVTNINISDLFFNPQRLIKQLEKHFGKCDYKKFYSIWRKFIKSNQKYFQAEKLASRVKRALEENIDFEIKDKYTLHDQGYLIYYLEKIYNIKEIPPYDCRNWFKNTQEIRTCLKLIHSQ